LRILIGCDTFAPDINGSASFTRQLAVGMTRRGHEVVITAPAPKGVKPGVYREEHGGEEFEVHRIYSWPWPFHAWFRYSLPWRITANMDRVVGAVRPDVIHFQSHIVFGRGLAKVARRRGIRLVGTNHTMPENIVQHVRILPGFIVRQVVRAQWTSARKVFGAAQAITTPTRSAADYFERETGLTGVHAISNGLRLSNYRADLGPRAERRIVYLGRVDEEKNIADLVRAVALLDPASYDGVDILGEGDQRAHLQQLATELGLADRVRLPGRVSYDELRETLTNGTVFAMPSTAELQSITTMEAMASGLPIVAADAMALPHLVTDGENGYLHPPHDVVALADRLARVLALSPAGLEAMRRASLEKVQVHDLDRTLDFFEALYRGEPLAD